MQNKPLTPWYGVDLDGTLADHYWPDKGHYDPYRIGAPIPQMVERIKMWLSQGMDVRIFTARVGPQGSWPGAVDEDLERIKQTIRDWTLEHVGVALEPTCTKDYGMLTLWDDRAIQVRFNTGMIADPFVDNEADGHTFCGRCGSERKQ